MEINISVLDRKGRKLIELKEKSTFSILECKKALMKSIKISLNRIYLTYQKEKSSEIIVLKENSKSFQDYGIQSDCSLIFKDLGIQISYRGVFYIEYFGPLMIFTILITFQKQIYGSNFKLSGFQQY